MVTNEKSKADFQDSLILIGNANVGKSVIFGLLTGQYVVVSNYPGTTVEITRGKISLPGKIFQIIDTPGVASLLPMSADEVVTRDILLNEKNSVVLQVADGKNPARALLLSLQLAEMGIPFVLNLNMTDEAREKRVYTNEEKLSQILGVPVTSTVAVTRAGLDRLRKNLVNPQKSHFKFEYDENIESAVTEICEILPDFTISRRSLALMILAEDRSIYPLIRSLLPDEKIRELIKIIRRVRAAYSEPVSFIINQARIKIANSIVKEAVTFEEAPKTALIQRFGSICMHHLWGIPIFLLTLLIMYLFVGRFAAGTLVDFLYGTLFGKLINPFLTSLIAKIIPIQIIQEALMGEYGVISVGLTYAIAIILPIVGAFFLFFGLLEDSGYLPRLAVMCNKIFCWIGLNGKAVLPMILGLGCGTMATLSARVLDTRRERLMVIILLALGVPCSAQLGLIMGMLSGLSFTAFMLWLLVVLGSLLLVGYAANKILPGDSCDFVMEIPPLRIPAVKNIVIKTWARVGWYLSEAVPLFMAATFVLFLSYKIGLLTLIEKIASPVIVNVLGLPAKTAQIFIVGFLRRDYGAAGFLDLAHSGILNNNQAFISMVTITLFLPCLSQFLVIIKERGVKDAFLIALFTLIYSFSVGGLLNLILNLWGFKL